MGLKGRVESQNYLLETDSVLS